MLLLGFVTLVAGAVSWYAGLELGLPMLWRARLLSQARSAPLLLPPPQEGGLALDASPDLGALLDDVTATRRGALIRDFSSARDGLPVYLRTVARIVDQAGDAVGLPYTLEDQAATRSVVVSFVVVDLRDRVPAKLTFHFELGGEKAVGDEGLIQGLLDGPTRRLLGPGDKLTLSEGFLVLEAPFLLADRTLGPVVEALAHMARRLVRVCGEGGAPNVASLLLENLAPFEPSEGPEEEGMDHAQVRATAVDLLIRNHRLAADEAAARGLADPSPEVRFAAARHLREEGFAFVESVAFEGEGVGSKADGLRQRALRFLIREFPSPRVLPLLERAVRSGPDTVRYVALRQIAHLQHRPAIEWMQGLADNPERETVLAGCEALAQLGPHPLSEGLLVQLLGRPDPLMQKAAVEALAQVGTVASAAALAELIETTSSRELRLSAGTTLQLVQARGGEGALGALSLAEGKDPGDLSLAEGECGDAARSSGDFGEVA
ncbi:MAG: HEAT repeat domain-containing protein [Myxococcota bacterium]